MKSYNKGELIETAPPLQEKGTNLIKVPLDNTDSFKEGDYFKYDGKIYKVEGCADIDDVDSKKCLIITTYRACCEAMSVQLNSICPQHGDNCPDWVVGVSREYRKMPCHLLLMAPNACYSFTYCPWCGKEIPKDGDKETLANWTDKELVVNDME
jgi:hypothetical protein